MQKAEASPGGEEKDESNLGIRGRHVRNEVLSLGGANNAEDNADNSGGARDPEKERSDALAFDSPNGVVPVHKELAGSGLLEMGAVVRSGEQADACLDQRAQADRGAHGPGSVEVFAVGLLDCVEVAACSDDFEKGEDGEEDPASATGEAMAECHP